MRFIIIFVVCLMAYLQPLTASSDAIERASMPPSAATAQRSPEYKPITENERTELQTQSEKTAPAVSQQRAGDYDGGPVDNWVFLWTLLVVVAFAAVVL